MTEKEIYKMYTNLLKQAIIDFSKPPTEELRNTGGLCDYLYYKVGHTYDNISDFGIKKTVKEILGKKYSENDFTIDPHSQKYLWGTLNKKKHQNTEWEKRFYKRSEWCKQRIKELEKIKELTNV